MLAVLIIAACLFAGTIVHHRWYAQRGWMPSGAAGRGPGDPELGHARVASALANRLVELAKEGGRSRAVGSTQS